LNQLAHERDILRSIQKIHKPGTGLQKISDSSRVSLASVIADSAKTGSLGVVAIASHLRQAGGREAGPKAGIREDWQD
jgi:hypothetical protein